MPTINIDFDVYLPSVTTYFNYLELLRAHHFIPPDQQIDSLIDSMVEVLKTMDEY
ncbi:MAG: hypothetical protein K9W44_04205 [Candidatus Lokiarchaeota archaeon]|nr:hypothetical protein [Candidatus Harpocratesius repetitus]